MQEIVPFIEERFSVFGGRDKRALFGKSSGGYAAFFHGMRHHDFWGAVASHSGDAYWEHCFIPEFRECLKVLQKYDDDPNKFLEHFWKQEKVKGEEITALLTIGMAAHYDPDPDEPSNIWLPFDLHSGEIDWQAWDRWCKWDPVRILKEPGVVEGLKSLKGFYFDIGTKDQFGLLYGNRILHQKLEAAGVEHFYEEFDDNHSDVDYRMNISLPWLYHKLMDG